MARELGTEMATAGVGVAEPNFIQQNKNNGIECKIRLSSEENGIFYFLWKRQITMHKDIGSQYIIFRCVIYDMMVNPEIMIVI
jgi:hypothetical protein